LEKSRCWAKSNGGITCLSCHNPHQSRVRDLASYDDKCLGCHRSRSSAVSAHDHPLAVCKVSANNCVSCHMPKYEMPGMQFKFTDHFIRIVHKGEPYPD
jgi:predicted CXXCH cytochrome family protein